MFVSLIGIDCFLYHFSRQFRRCEAIKFSVLSVVLRAEATSTGRVASLLFQEWAQDGEWNAACCGITTFRTSSDDDDAQVQPSDTDLCQWHARVLWRWEGNQKYWTITYLHSLEKYRKQTIWKKRIKCRIKLEHSQFLHACSVLVINSVIQLV